MPVWWCICVLAALWAALGLVAGVALRAHRLLAWRRWRVLTLAAALRGLRARLAVVEPLAEIGRHRRDTLARYRARRKNRPGEAVIRLPALKSARGRG